MNFTKFRSKRIIRMLDGWILRGSNVLDIGCGNGIVGIEIRKYFKVQITGADICFPRTQYLPIDIIKSRFSYKDKEFDIALLIDVLHHAKDWKFLLSEARRVAKTVLVYEVAPSLIVKITDFNSRTPSRPKTFADWITEFKNLGIGFEGRWIKSRLWYPAENFAFKI